MPNMTVKDMAQKIKDLWKNERLYDEADTKARHHQSTIATALDNNRKYQESLIDCISWQQGPHSLQEILIMAIMTAYSLENLQYCEGISNSDWTGKDLAKAIRLTDGIIAALEQETGTTREEIGLESFRPRRLDTTTLFKQAENKAKTILKEFEHATSEQKLKTAKIETDCPV